MRQAGVGLYLKLAPKLGGGGVMYKCDMCHDLIQQGKNPACVAACPQGYQPSEEDLALQHGFAPVTLGPRVLRAETAPLAALAALTL